VSTSCAAGQPLAEYRRRTPEQTVLHEMVARHAQTMFADLRNDRTSRPRRQSRQARRQMHQVLGEERDVAALHCAGEDRRK